MTNSDCDELVKLADELIAQNYGNVCDADAMEEHFVLLAKAATALRRLASSDGGVKVRELEWSAPYETAHQTNAVSAVSSCGRYIATDNGWFLCGETIRFEVGNLDAAKAAAQADYEARIRSALVEVPAVKGEPEPVKWPANLNPRTLDLVQRFALALAKKLRLAEEKYDHTDGWLRDDWESECRDHLYQHLEKGDPRDVAAYCAFMWHHGWITYRPEITAPPSDAGIREALAYAESLAVVLWSKHFKDIAPHWKPLTGDLIGLLTQIDNMTAALIALGATTKSDGVRWGDSGPIPGQHFGDEFAAEPSPSDPSSTRREVTVEELARTMVHAVYPNSVGDRWFERDPVNLGSNRSSTVALAGEYACALLDQFEIRRK